MKRELSMGVTLKKIHPLYVAEISGVDISRPLDAPIAATLQAAIDDHAVMVFRGQTLTDEQQIAFARHFGAPERFALSYRHNVKLRLQKPEMVDVSNLDASTGKPQSATARHRMVNLGNRLWHTDSSFRLPAGGLSMLYAHAVPPMTPLGGGETEFSDTRAAWDALPASRQAVLEGLTAQHSLMHSRAVLGFSDFAPEERAALPPVEQPLVRRHPRTGRKSLYLASHAAHIIGMEVAEGRLLLMELIEHATQREFVYRHNWQVGDLVVWDNRCTMHRGMPFDETFPRDLRRVTTKDGVAPEAVAA
jgi:alpha-ketoglutarate-dependent 2,4-dichlorophenoxyacetate dioxygenase